MENKTAEELKQLRTQIIKKHLSFVEDGTDEMKLIFAYHSAMEEYTSLKLAEKDKVIEGFAIGFSEWFILNGIEKARIDGHYWVRGNIYLNKTELIELYKQSLNK